MKRIRDASIRTKLIWVAMITTGFALVAATTAFVVYDRHEFEESVVSSTTTLADVVGTNAASALLFMDQASAKETLGALRAEPNVPAACIYDLDGQPFAIYHRTSGSEIGTIEDLCRSMPGRVATAMEPHHHRQPLITVLGGCIDIQIETIF